MAAPPARSRAEVVLSLGVLALGIGAAYVAFSLPETGGYARVGPNFMPKFVAAGLVAIGVWLLAEVFTGGWREAVPDDRRRAASTHSRSRRSRGSARACSCRWR